MKKPIVEAVSPRVALSRRIRAGERLPSRPLVSIDDANKIVKMIIPAITPLIDEMIISRVRQLQCTYIGEGIDRMVRESIEDRVKVTVGVSVRKPRQPRRRRR